MRIVDVGLLHKALETEKIPVAGCCLPIFDVNKSENTQHRSSYIPYGDRYARLDWKAEPTRQQKEKAAEILAYQANVETPLFDEIIDVGCGFSEVDQNSIKLPIKIAPSSSRFVTEEIIEILHWALTQEVNIMSPFAEFSISNSWVQASKDTLSRVEQVLKKQGALEFFDNGVIFLGNASSRVQLQDLVHWLLAQSLKSSPETAVKQLHQFVKIDAIPVERIVGIRGINIRSIADLGEGIKLVPFSEIYDSPIKKTLEKSSNFSHFKPSLKAIPKAALVQSVLVKPKIASDFINQTIDSVSEKPLENLFDVLNCLALVGSCAPIALCEYYQVPEWVPLSSKGWGIISPIHEINPDVSSISDREFTLFNESEAREIIQKYSKLRQEIKQKLDLPIERLNRAIRRKDNVDKAIELRIALESILTADRDKDAPISFLIRIRGSLLLGGSPDKRRESAKLLGELYNLCSKAVHNGNLDYISKKHKLPTKYVLHDGIEICANLIKKIIKNGSFPNWDNMILGID